jgi:hypothetical protein
MLLRYPSVRRVAEHAPPSEPGNIRFWTVAKETIERTTRSKGGKRGVAGIKYSVGIGIDGRYAIVLLSVSHAPLVGLKSSMPFMQPQPRRARMCEHLLASTRSPFRRC